MNIAALFAGPITDLCRFSVPAEGIDIFDAHMSPIRVVLFIAAMSTFTMVGVACFMREVATRSDGQVEAFKPKKRTLYQVVTETCYSKPFRQLMVLSALLTGVKSVFRHLDGTFPKYFIREIGNNAPYGMIYAINPAIIIVMVPIVSAHFSKVKHYDMILWGSWVTGASPFILCFGASIFSAALWNIILSFGEAVYSPRTYDIQMQLAPEGEEGLYSALAGAPMYAAKLMVGGMSGYLLQNYCPGSATNTSSSSSMTHRGHNNNTVHVLPSSTECDSFVLWGVIGLSTVSSPALLCFMRSFIEPDYHENHHQGSKGETEDEAGESLVNSFDEDDMMFEMISTGNNNAVVRLSDDTE